MPKIEIFEDVLKPASETIGSDIPYIPGFAYKTSGTIPTDPVLCTNTVDFEATFGDKPVQFDDASGVVNKFDTSYVMARELLALGMPVYYHAIKTPATAVDASIMAAFNNDLGKFLNTADIGSENLSHKGEYTIKYITTGGYPNFQISAELEPATGSGDDAEPAVTANLHKLMMTVAKDRGDCVALIEATKDQTTLDPTKPESFYYKLNEDTTNITADLESFGAAFIGWGEYTLSKTYTLGTGASAIKVDTAILPACYGYLAALAFNTKASPNWLAMAGTTRGLVPKLNKLELPTGLQLNNAVANKYQPLTATGSDARALNAITYIKPYGLCIWGNRTLKTVKNTATEPLVGTHFLNIRNMISDIKKVAYRTATSLIYEQNNEMLWLNFKSQMSPFLEQLKSGSGIADYKLIKTAVKNDGTRISKEEFACAIKIYPVYAVEAFDITVVVSDADVEVE